MNCITFFAGAGGLDMGIHNAGFDVRMCLEIEDKYCETLRINHPDWNVVNGDIMDLTAADVLRLSNIEENEEIDLMAGGSPCQSFSTQGKRQSFADPRGQAMLKYIDLVMELQPRVFLLENVKGLLSAALEHRPLSERGGDNPPLTDNELPGSALRFLLDRIDGYNVEVHTVNAANYGVPQKRERVFIIGVRADIHQRFIMPPHTHSKDGIDLPRWITLREVLNEVDGTVQKHTFTPYSPSRLRFMKMIPQGGGCWRDLPEELQPEALGGAYNSTGGRIGFFRRLKIDEPSPTLLTSPSQNSTNLGHPFEDRPLSVEEYLAIQGFPYNYVLNGSTAAKYVQIGNAVPVQMAYAIAKGIFEFLEQL